MSDEDLSNEATVQISLGHMLLVREIISNKLSGSFNDNFTEEEKRAIWALEDLFDDALIKNGITARPQLEWEELVNKAREFIKTVPVDYLD